VESIGKNTKREKEHEELAFPGRTRGEERKGQLKKTMVNKGRGGRVGESQLERGAGEGGCRPKWKGEGDEIKKRVRGTASTPGHPAWK